MSALVFVVLVLALVGSVYFSHHREQRRMARLEAERLSRGRLAPTGRHLGASRAERRQVSREAVRSRAEQVRRIIEERGRGD